VHDQHCCGRSPSTTSPSGDHRAVGEYASPSSKKHEAQNDERGGRHSGRSGPHRCRPTRRKGSGRGHADRNVEAGAAAIAEALDAGLTDVGENRAQELLAKAPILAERPVPPRWHFVGRLQRNKVAALTSWVGCWHSVDRPALGEAIARRAPGARVLVEVNLGEEPTKGGCAPGEVDGLVEALSARPRR
jgi:hypothetical protein